MANSFLEKAYYPVWNIKATHIANKDSTIDKKPIFYSKDTTTLPTSTSGFITKEENSYLQNPKSKNYTNILYYKSDSPPNGILKRSQYTLFLKEDKQKIIVLEHGVGYRCLWSKIAIEEDGYFIDTIEEKKYKNTGYIESYFIENIIEPDQTIAEKIFNLKLTRFQDMRVVPEPIKPSGGNILLTPLLSKKLYPDPFAPKIVWKDLLPSSLYNDNYNGKYIYIHDTLTDKLSPPAENDLWEQLKQYDEKLKKDLLPSPPIKPEIANYDTELQYRAALQQYNIDLRAYNENNKALIDSYKELYEQKVNEISILYLRQISFIALKEGVKRILQEVGKLPSQDEINKNKLIFKNFSSLYTGELIDLENLCDNLVSIYLNYYFQFAKVEGIYLPGGKCTTIRILITMPKIYAHSNDLENFTTEKILEDGWLSNTDFYEDAQESVKNNPEDRNEVILFFRDYYQFDQTIKNIIDRLRSVASIYYLNEWLIDPSDITSIDIMQEIDNLEKFKLSINLYLAANIDRGNINISADFWDFLEGRALFVPTTSFSWDGSLKLTIDKETRQIKFIEFFNKHDEDRPDNFNKWSGAYEAPGDLGPIPISYVDFTNYKIGRQNSINILNSKILENGIINNSTTINYLLKGREICSTFLIPIWMPHQAGDFMIDFHYPKINNMSIKQTDISKCLNDTVQRAKSVNDWKKKLDVNKTVKSLKEIAQAQQEDMPAMGDFFQNFTRGMGSFVDGKFKPTGILTQFRNEPALQWLWNFYPPEIPQQADWTDALDYVTHYVSAIKEVGASEFLQDVIRCAAANGTVGFEDFIAGATFGVNSGLAASEAALSATLCNPWLTRTFDFIDSIDLSILSQNIPIYNPTAEIARSLLDYYSQVIIKLIITGVKELILNAIRQCIRENVGKLPSTPGEDPLRPNYDNISPKDSILNGINDGQNNSPDAFNKLAADFGINNINDPSPLESAKNRMNNFFDDLTCMVTVRNLCRLLTDKDVDIEVYIAIKNLISIKYPELKQKYYSNIKIKELFAIFGKFIPADFCDRLSQNPELPDNWRCLNENPTPAEIFGDRVDIPEQALQDFLDEIKNKDREFLQAISKVLDPDINKTLKNILENTPPALCRKDADGNLIPPAADLSVPVSQFRKMLLNQVQDIYEKFDKEAESWVKSNKTIDYNLVELSDLSEDNKNKLQTLDSTLEFFIDETNKRQNIKLKIPKTPLSLQNGIITPNAVDQDQYSKVKGSKQNPAYIYNKITPKFNDGILKTNINGYDAQILETDLIEEQNILKVNSLKKEIINFFLQLHEDMGLYASTMKSAKGRVIFESVIELDNNASSALKNWVRNVFMRDIYRYIIIITTGDLKEIKNFVDINEYSISNARFALDNNINFIVPLMTECLKEENEKYLKELIAVLSRNSTSSNMFTNLSKEEQELREPLQRYTNAWTSIKNGYNLIKNNIEIIESISSYFPSFELTSSVGTSVKDVLSNQALNDLSNSIMSDSLIDYYNLHIKSKEFTYANISKYKKYPEEYKDFIVNELKQQNLPYYDKSELFSRIFTKTDKYKWIYKDIEKILFKRINTNIKTKNLFLKNYLESNVNFEYQDQDKNKSAINYGFVANYTNFADFLNLKIEDEYIPKNDCPKPHFLDIISLIKEAVEAKKNSYCIEEVKSFGEDVKTSDLEKQQLDETRFIIINCLLKLAIRIYMSDYLLRGFPVFGYYDPQSLSGDELFIDFIYGTMKEELLSTDGLYFQLITNFLQNKYIKDNGLTYDKNEFEILKSRRDQDPENFPPNEALRLAAIESTIKELQNIYTGYDSLFKDYISQELNKNILLKLSFRINDDSIKWSARSRLNRFNEAKSKNFNFSLRNLEDDILNKNSYYEFLEEDISSEPGIKNIATYIKYTRSLYKGNKDASDKLSSINEKIEQVEGDMSKLSDEDKNLINTLQREYESLIETGDKSVIIETDISKKIMIVKVKIHNNTLSDFIAQESMSKKIFFDYLFPIKRYLSLNFILCFLSYNTRKRDTQNFRGSKSSIRRTTKMIFANGENITPNANSAQELVNSDPSTDFIWLIVDILLMTPLRILKGFCEASDLNVNISSTIYKTLKAFLPNTTALLVPAVGTLTGFAGIPPLPFGWIYYGAGLFLIDQGNDNITNFAKYIDNSIVLGKFLEDNDTQYVCRENLDSTNPEDRTRSPGYEDDGEDNRLRLDEEFKWPWE